MLLLRLMAAEARLPLGADLLLVARMAKCAVLVFLHGMQRGEAVRLVARAARRWRRQAIRPVWAVAVGTTARQVSVEPVRLGLVTVLARRIGQDRRRVLVVALLALLVTGWGLGQLLLVTVAAGFRHTGGVWVVTIAAFRVAGMNARGDRGMALGALARGLFGRMQRPLMAAGTALVAFERRGAGKLCRVTVFAHATIRRRELGRCEYEVVRLVALGAGCVAAVKRHLAASFFVARRARLAEAVQAAHFTVRMRFVAAQTVLRVLRVVVCERRVTVVATFVRRAPHVVR